MCFFPPILVLCKPIKQILINHNIISIDFSTLAQTTIFRLQYSPNNAECGEKKKKKAISHVYEALTIVTSQNYNPPFFFSKIKKNSSLNNYNGKKKIRWVGSQEMWIFFLYVANRLVE